MTAVVRVAGRVHARVRFGLPQPSVGRVARRLAVQVPQAGAALPEGTGAACRVSPHQRVAVGAAAHYQPEAASVLHATE